MSLFDFLNRLSGDKSIVGIYISSASIMEVAEFDMRSKQVHKFAQFNVSYDPVTRQLPNMQMIELGIQKAFEDLKIKPNTPVVLTLPSILMGHQTLPLDLQQDEIRLALLSETERNYFFIKQEPVVSWEQISSDSEANTQYLFYSALQKKEVEKIKESFKKMKVRLLALDCSYAALIRGLSIAGYVKNDVIDGTLSCILLITINSYVIISLMGDKVIDIMEDPLAIKSFSQEDIYPTIKSYSIDRIKIKNPDHLIIISKSHNVSAEKLASHFDLTCKKDFIEQNKFNKKQLFNSVDDKNMVSLEAVGSSCWKQSDIPVSFNFVSKKGVVFDNYVASFELFGHTFYLSQNILQNILIGLIAASFVIMITILIVLNTIAGSYDAQNLELQSNLNKVKNQSSQDASANAVSSLISDTYKKEGNILDAYTQIGEAIPEKLWIEHLTVKNDLSLSVKGKAESIDDIINYYQNLTRSGKFTSLKIISLKLNGNSVLPKPNDVTVKASKNEDVDDNIDSDKINNLPHLPEVDSNQQKNYFEFEFGN